MNLAVIPARGGSKRIPRKNIKNFCGKPMIAWSIQAALASNCFDKVIVSTDDLEIADIAEQYGASIPFIRPATLSDDYTGTTAVVRHAIDSLNSMGEDYALTACIYATAPFVSGLLLKEAMSRLTNHVSDFVFSVTEFSYPIQRALRINSSGRVEMMNPEYGSSRSQDLEPAYHDAGQFYVGKTASWGTKGVLSTDSLPFVLPNYRVQDIDTPDDWKRAELMFRALQASGEL
ncbi:pseudaminic acid cytidylyltransferase [Aliidiomarina taiwanensis]|uniref:Pseudaminic acid cytidylyltransferase n=1 Tax=Aliidiomarina taiwanensis TaxID=946228 RepID=A0A432X8X6_9GAMM|nr:pseudaminic acid cytidylyltransferase [Aliidiomarina taiwanensis]RUO43774.1 pseudaminic acid cytidylyltransferase [Aliidiomarina taiwanensis]